MPENYKDLVRWTQEGKSQTQIAVSERMHQADISRKTRRLLEALKLFKKGGEVQTSQSGRFVMINPKEGAKSRKIEQTPIKQFIPAKNPHATCFDEPRPQTMEELDKLTRPTEEEGEMKLEEFLKRRGLRPETAEPEKEELPKPHQFDNLDLDALTNAILERMADKMAKNITRKIVSWFINP